MGETKEMYPKGNDEGTKVGDGDMGKAVAKPTPEDGVAANDPDMELANEVTHEVLKGIDSLAETIENKFKDVKGDVANGIKALLLAKLRDAVHGIKHNASTITFPNFFKVETAIMGNLPSGTLIILSSAQDEHHEETTKVPEGGN